MIFSRTDFTDGLLEATVSLKSSIKMYYYSRPAILTNHIRWQALSTVPELRKMLPPLYFHLIILVLFNNFVSLNHGI